MKKITLELIRTIIHMFFSGVAIVICYAVSGNKTLSIIVGLMFLFYLWGCDERKHIMDKLKSLDTNEKRTK